MLKLILSVTVLWTFFSKVQGCSSTNCEAVRTEAQGEITSPCYPQNYPNSLTCRWSLQAPAGFIIQLTFLDFDLEVATDCIYDRVVVNTGSADVTFCRQSANGTTLNSTGNVMELFFITYVNVQKRGFSVRFQHVAVSLKIQKVKITSTGSGQVTEVADSVSIPALSHLTVCFEVERSSLEQSERIFTYSDSSNNVALSLGSDQNEMKLMVDGVVCPMDEILSPSMITSSMKSFCVLWMSSSGRVEVYLDQQLKGQTCSESAGHSLPAAGNFQLGGQNSLNGNIYNVRLWDYAMSAQQLAALTCNSVGNIIDWEYDYWSVPSMLAHTDNTLNCTPAEGLRCKSCNGSCSNETTVTCTTETMCVTATITDTALGLSGTTRYYKACASSALCPITGSQTYELDLVFSGALISAECCDTDECNTNTLGVTDEAYGCASPSVCTASQRLGELPFLPELGTDSSGPSCCNTHDCNGGTTTTTPPTTTNRQPTTITTDTPTTTTTGLQCLSCTDSSCFSPVSVTCSSETMCITASIKDVMSRDESFFRGCAPPTLCPNSGTFKFSTDTVESNKIIDAECCDTNNCNSGTLPVFLLYRWHQLSNNVFSPL
ncbi:adhesion G-protein coupled receptor G6-like isoform X2 [Gouania willdenowi]|uniref:adhesion G-protein coupled receptor G6-like isoform X2 n=1 Tax=Gouania willdenowi TaxID=441366 RepID=UPI00105418B7|nr:adhesion G-protein coupled receptor G6-like isoform X2 [Gouania willdenowi]